MGKARKRARVVSRPPLEPLDSFELAGESRFARALGSCDFHTRERGFQALAAWLASGARVDEASLGKVWKGILFCFWHSDQQPVQKDLAERLARIMRDVSIEVRCLASLRTAGFLPARIPLRRRRSSRMRDTRSLAPVPCSGLRFTSSCARIALQGTDGH